MQSSTGRAIRRVRKRVEPANGTRLELALSAELVETIAQRAAEIVLSRLTSKRRRHGDT